MNRSKIPSGIFEAVTRITARAPSNIALVKYMGRENDELRLPANPSVSMTLNSLCSFVEAEWVEAARHRAEPERLANGRRASHQYHRPVFLPELPRLSTPLPLKAPVLSEQGRTRFSEHAQKTIALAAETLPKQGFEVRPSAFFSTSQLHIRSANTFPDSAGIASSASSFAALTLAAAASCLTDKGLELFQQKWKADATLRRLFSRLSRAGSGSSARSFEGPFVIWEGEEARALPSCLPPLCDLVLVLSEEKKSVSSSRAHELVKTSPLWNGRKERAIERAQQLASAIAAGDLRTVSEIAWTELWEMHSLFHTAAEPFTYFRGDTVEALRFAASAPQNAPLPIVTLDAGPNLHWIVPAEGTAQWCTRLQERFPGRQILADSGGGGAEII